MLHVSRYHSGSLKIRAASRFNISNFHTAFRNKNRARKPVTSVPTSSVPHMMQVLRSFRPFLIKRRRVPTLPASTMVKECAASSHLLFSSWIRPCSSRWRSHMGAVSSASALAILSRKLLTSSSGMCSMKSVATSLLTISGHLDEIQVICSHHTRGGGNFPLAASRVECPFSSASAGGEFVDGSVHRHGVAQVLRLGRWCYRPPLPKYF